MPSDPNPAAEQTPDSWGFLRPSALVLILANLGPVYGAVFLDWKVFPIILLFWFENLVIGALNVFRMLIADPRNKPLWLLKAFIIPFFCIHFGLFTFVHGIFVMGFFGGMFRSGAPFPDGDIVMGFISEYNLGWAIAGFAASHAISFFVNYIGNGEYLKASPATLMQQPYGRVVVLHITILAGGFLMMILRSPVAGLLLLIALKIALDLKSHLREHAVIGPSSPQPGD